MEFGTLEFSRTLLTNLMSKFKIKNGGCQYGKQIAKNDLISMKFGTRKRSKSLITYLNLKLKRRISSNTPNAKVTRLRWNFVEIAEIADYASDLEIWNPKWQMHRGWSKYNKQLDLSEFQGFRGRWFQIRPAIKNSWSNIVFLTAD